MPRKNAGGKSIRWDFCISPELHKAMQAKMRQLKIKSPSDAARQAFAAFCGDEDLAEMPAAGRPKKKQKKKVANKNSGKSG